MSDAARLVYHLSIAAIIFILCALALLYCVTPTPESAPPAPIKHQVLSYPFRDNSTALRAAEAKVAKRIDKVESDYCAQHMNDSPRCGAWQRRAGKWEKAR